MGLFATSTKMTSKKLTCRRMLGLKAPTLKMTSITIPTNVDLEGSINEDDVTNPPE